MLKLIKLLKSWRTPQKLKIGNIPCEISDKLNELYECLSYFGYKHISNEDFLSSSYFRALKKYNNQKLDLFLIMLENKENATNYELICKTFIKKQLELRKWKPLENTTKRYYCEILYHFILHFKDCSICFIDKKETEAVKTKKRVDKKQVPAKTKQNNSNTELDKLFDLQDSFMFNNVEVFNKKELMESFAKKQNLQLDKNNKTYGQIYYRNQTYLNLALIPTQIKKNQELYDYLLKADKIGKCGFSRIYNIDDTSSPLNVLSHKEQYFDFINSEFIKDKNYFEIIYEYKKGDGTRNYLDLFLNNLKQEQLENGMSEDEFENRVDEALANFELPIEDVELFSPDIEFISELKLSDKMLYFSHMPKEEKLFSYNGYDDYIKHNIAFDLEQDKKTFQSDMCENAFSKIAKTPFKQIVKLKDIVTKDNDYKTTWAEILNLEGEYINLVSTYLDYAVNTNVAIKSRYGSNEGYLNFTKQHSEWIFYYNKELLQKKKEFILQYFSS